MHISVRFVVAQTNRYRCLLWQMVAQARSPVFTKAMVVTDTVNGRLRDAGATSYPPQPVPRRA